MSLYQSIAGKYFINSLAAGLHMKALMRGRIVGPISNEYSPFYLCEIFPSDDEHIAVTTQTVMQIDQLVGVYFYEDRRMLDAAWADAMRRAKAQMLEARRQRSQMMKTIERRLVKTLKAEGIDVVDASLVTHAATEATLVMAAAEAGGSAASVLGAEEMSDE